MKKHISILYIAIAILLAVMVIGYRTLDGRLDQLGQAWLAESLSEPQLYIDGEQYDSEGIRWIDDRLYLAYDLAVEVIDPSIELSNSGQRVYVKVDPELIDSDNAELNAYLKENIVDVNIPLVTEEDQRYLDLEMLSRMLQFHYGEAGHDRWIITRSQYRNAVVGKSSSIYANENLNLEKTALDEDQPVHACESNGAVFVAMQGLVGYAKAEDVAVLDVEAPGFSQYLSRVPMEKQSPFYLVWDQINSYQQSLDFDRELLEKNADILSPTWLSLNVNGIVINSANLEYVRWAHSQQIAVWMLVDNSFSPEWTREMISDPVLVDRFISQLVLYSALYECDGINIDFENIYLEDSDLLSAFVDRLDQVLDMTGMTLSMDVTVPEGSDQWSKVYDRKALGQSVDYLMVMAYDEYWASSSESGPVASIPWTIEGMEKTLELVDHEKVVLGIPGYMRVWKESGGSTDSSVLSMKHRDNYLSENGYEPVYLEEMGINYAEKKEGGLRTKIWIEDTLSLGKRLDLLESYDLPGVALWRRGFFDSEAENLIGERLGN